MTQLLEFTLVPDQYGKITQEEHLDALREKLVQSAQDVLEGRLGILEGSMQINSLIHDLDLDDDPEFLIFIDVDSDCDRFAFGETRKLWAPSLLAERDPQMAEAAESYSPDVKDACRIILERFKH